MSLLDGLGVFGVFLVLAAYAAATVGKLDPKRAPALLLNLVGAGFILASLLTEAFNLSAFLMEFTWALVAAFGLLRLALAKKA